MRWGTDGGETKAPFYVGLSEVGGDLQAFGEVVVVVCGYLLMV